MLFSLVLPLLHIVNLYFLFHSLDRYGFPVYAVSSCFAKMQIDMQIYKLTPVLCAHAVHAVIFCLSVAVHYEKFASFEKFSTSFACACPFLLKTWCPVAGCRTKISSFLNFAGSCLI